jgi:hypothetical protein
MPAATHNFGRTCQMEPCGACFTGVSAGRLC